MIQKIWYVYVSMQKKNTFTNNDELVARFLTS